MIRFFKLLLLLFKLDASDREKCLSVSKLVYLAVTFVSKTMDVEKKLSAISKALLNKDKTVQNEQMFSINAG